MKYYSLVQIQFLETSKNNFIICIVHYMYERPKDNQKPKYKNFFFERCSCRLFFGFSHWLIKRKKHPWSHSSLEIRFVFLREFLNFSFRLKSTYFAVQISAFVLKRILFLVWNMNPGRPKRMASFQIRSLNYLNWEEG